MRDYREKDVKGMLAIWNPRKIPTFIHDTVTRAGVGHHQGVGKE